MYIPTYLTSSRMLPEAQRTGVPVMVLNREPTEAMDRKSFDTGKRLANCGSCGVPEKSYAGLRGGTHYRAAAGEPEEDEWAGGVEAGQPAGSPGTRSEWPGRLAPNRHRADRSRGAQSG